MIRLAWFTLKLAALVALAVWLANQPGDVRIVWFGYEIRTSAAFLAAAAFLVVATCLYVYRIIRFFSPARWRIQHKLQQITRGQQKLTEGLVAVAAGDAVEAGRKAVAARKLLGTTTATRLLQAQAAQLAGDQNMAEEIFEQLTEDPHGTVLGYRGLITAALKAGKWDDAATLAAKLERLKPETPWLQLIKLELAARQGEWLGAAEALKKALLTRAVSQADARFRQAALHVGEAQQLARENRAEAALQAAEQAARMQPRWLPAVIELAEAQLRVGHERVTRHTVERAWREEPHPELARLYLRLLREDEDLAKLKKIENLCRHNAEHPESRIACAEAAINARLWGEARRHLLALVNEGTGKPDRRAFRLMAMIEQQEHHDQAAAARWLARAAEAKPEPQWLCVSCGGTSPRWQAACAHCREFATLEWRVPGESRDTAAPAPLRIGRGG